VGGRGGASNAFTKRRDSSALRTMRSQDCFRFFDRRFLIGVAMMRMSIKVAHKSNPAHDHVCGASAPGCRAFGYSD
jgi:hypothetical protein